MPQILESEGCYNCVFLLLFCNWALKELCKHPPAQRGEKSLGQRSLLALHSWCTCGSKPQACTHAESLCMLGLGLLPPAVLQDIGICSLIPSLTDLFVHSSTHLSSHSSLSSFSYSFTRQIFLVLPLCTRTYPGENRRRQSPCIRDTQACWREASHTVSI